MKEQVSRLARSAVVQYVTVRIMCSRRREMQNKTIARLTDKYNYITHVAIEHIQFLKVN